MPSPSIYKDDCVFTDTVTFQKAPVMPASSLGGTQLSTSDKVPTNKQFHERVYGALISNDTVEITAQTVTLGIVESAGLISKVSAVIPGAIATGADRTVTVNVQKSTSMGAFATVLSSNISIDTATVVRDSLQATIDTAQDDVVAGDLLRAVISVAGAASAQAKGLYVGVTITDSSPTV